MSEEQGRGIWLGDGPIPDLPTGPRVITDCTVTFTLTELPLNARGAVIRTMVDAANRMLHSTNIYPCPQLRHVVEGLDVNLPTRVRGDVATSVAVISPPDDNRPLSRQETDMLATVVQTLEQMGGQVVNTGAVMTLYVDTNTGRADGHGTLTSPFNSIGRAQVHARQFGRRAIIRDLSGRILLDSSAREPMHAPAPPPPAPSRPRITPTIRIQ
jgi:hypothetical protein